VKDNYLSVLVTYDFEKKPWFSFSSTIMTKSFNKLFLEEDFYQMLACIQDQIIDSQLMSGRYQLIKIECKGRLSGESIVAVFLKFELFKRFLEKNHFISSFDVLEQDTSFPSKLIN
jgi:hypothetical protein